MVKTYKDIAESESVAKALSNVDFLKKPTKKIEKYLNLVGTLDEHDNESLETFLSVFTAWQNYSQYLLVMADIIRTIAEDQKSFYYSLALSGVTSKVVADKKSAAEVNDNYKKAKDVYSAAVNNVKALQVLFDSCDRAYKLTSRILSKRLNIKEY